MRWDVEFTDEFGDWWSRLTIDEQEKVAIAVGRLAEVGTALDFPYSSGVNSTRYPHMRELRIQVHGNPFRVLYAFDPRRIALLLIGGDKTGSSRWYEIHIPLAEKLYREHLERIKEKIDGEQIQ